jgi:hypothetical protein
MPKKERKSESEEHNGAAEKRAARKPDAEQPEKGSVRYLTLDQVANLVLPGGPSEKY